MSSPAFDINSHVPDLVETSLKEGTLFITKDGVEAAALISIEDWKQFKAARDRQSDELRPRRSLKDVLLDPHGSHDIYIPPRGRYRRRAPIELE